MKQNLSSTKQIKLGALLSYAAIAFNIIAGLIYTPWMISKIGQSNYGLYTLATSLITMFVMDFGMSAAVTKFMSRYIAEGDQEGANNFLGLVYKLYLAIDAVILTILVVIYFFIDTIYANLLPAEIESFKVLYIIVGCFSVISFPFTNLNGILQAHEKFIQLKLCDLFHKVIIVVAMVIALLAGFGVYALVTVNAISGLLTILLKLIVIHRRTQVKSNFKFFDKKIFKDIFGFSIWTTTVSIAQRLIFNLTPSIVAAVSITGSIGVAIFGLASTIEGYVSTLSTAINGMFMARISRIVVSNKKDKDLMPLMNKVGRIQLMLIGFITVCFIALGKSFVVDIWRKPDFIETYYCAILLILPSVFYTPMQIATTTLVVEDKVRLQAIVYLVMGVINVICSLILSKLFGAIGASVSIFIAYMVRTILLACIYQKVLKINMPLFMKETFLKISPYLLIVLLFGVLCERVNPLPHGFIRFAINGCLMVLVFILLAVRFIFNSYEKTLFLGFLKKKK